MVCLVLVAGLLAVGRTAVHAVSGSASPHTVTGTFDIYDAVDLAGVDQGGDCTSALQDSGYSDIEVGSAVNVTNQNNTFLASGSLTGGTLTQDGVCSFGFTITGVPQANAYGFTVSHRGTIWYTAGQIQGAHWVVGLTLGDSTSGSGTSSSA